MNGNSVSRHAACIECRQRKVRCDGRQPCCDNCFRRGAECVYAKAANQDRQDMIVMIKELSERLARAEEALATNQSPDPSLPSGVDSASQAFATVAASDASFLSWDDALLGFDTPQQYASSPSSPIWRTPENLHAPPFADELPSQAMHKLYARYFERSHKGCFLVDEERFTSRAALFDARLEFQSLRLIILAHGAAISPEHSCLAGKFYEQSHRAFKQMETGKGFATITALQACILLAQYELEHTLFSRASASISRACWMAQMFGLDRMDQHLPSPQQHHLAETSDVHELEERRGAFWSTYILSCFADVGLGWNTFMASDGAEISTYLPAATSVTDSPSRITLSDAFRLSNSARLDISQALVVASVLYGRCLVHVQHARHECVSGRAKYDFWMHHYHLSETAHHLAEPGSSSEGDADALCFKLNMQAVKICLYHAVIVRGATASVRQLALESKTRCVDAARDVAELIQTAVELAQTRPSVPWFLHAASQACIRALHLNDLPASLPATPHGGLPASGQQKLNGDGSAAAAGPLDSLLGALDAFKRFNPVSGDLAAKLRDEPNGSEPVADDRVIGIADFAFDGCSGANTVGQLDVEVDPWDSSWF